MAGNQVLEWADLDTEIKTAGVKNVSAACHTGGFKQVTYALLIPRYAYRTRWLPLTCEPSRRLTH